MTKTKNKPVATRIALQLPDDLNQWFMAKAKEKLTSKSALIRAALADHVKSQLA